MASTNKVKQNIVDCKVYVDDELSKASCCGKMVKEVEDRVINYDSTRSIQLLSIGISTHILTVIVERSRLTIIHVIKDLSEVYDWLEEFNAWLDRIT